MSSEKVHNSDVSEGWDNWRDEKLEEESEDTEDISGQTGPFLCADLDTIFLSPLTTLLNCNLIDQIYQLEKSQ